MSETEQTPETETGRGPTLETLEKRRCFGGWQGVYRHESAACACPMTFGLFLPPQADAGPVPLLWWLSGLTCTHENAMTKAGAQAWAADLGLALVFPDTSPRGADVADDDAFDLGQGAGFYLDAVEAPWAAHFQMKRYILEELPALLVGGFPLDAARQGISGHSMGGHGALTLAAAAPGRFRSVSAFAPIAAPTRSEWGRKQFAAYLGPDEAAWAAYDASVRIAAGDGQAELLVDVGGADPFKERLRIDDLAAAAASAGVDATIREQPDYDHSYFFVASFFREHAAWHAERLRA